MPAPVPNTANILAGIGPSALAFFAPVDTAGPVGATGTAGVQTVTISGTPTGGTFTLTWRGYVTSALAYNAASSAVQAALNALPKGATITVTGTAGGPYTVNFPAALPQSVMTATGSFTGGTSPTVAVTNTTPGVQTTTMATAAIPASFITAGWCDQSGLVANVNESSSTVKGFGSTQTLRVLISESARSFDLNFLETNAVTSAVYNRMLLTSVVPDAQGHWAVNLGPAVVATYAGIFDIVDGSNHLRVYSPRLQVSGIKSRSIASGKEITYGVTLTALPDLNGNAVYEDYIVDALAA